jgi:electron transfer flavoprotein beta subunit
MKLELEGANVLVTKEIEGGKEKLSLPMPCVLGCQEPIAEWKIPNMRGIMTARTKPLLVVTPQASAFTSISKYELPAAKGACKMIAAEEAETLISMLRNEAKVL